MSNKTSKHKPRVRHIWLDDEYYTQPKIGTVSVFRAQPKKRRRRLRVRYIELSGRVALPRNRPFLLSH